MLTSFIQTESLKKFTGNLLLIGLFFHLLAAWFNTGYYHPDEYFQITEFASFKSGKTPAGDLAWEYNAAIRPALQPAMICWISTTLHIASPVVISFIMRMLSSVAAWFVTALFILISLGEVRSDEMKKTSLILATFFWFMPFIHTRFSSENWSSIFFFAGLSILLLKLKSGSYAEKIKSNILPLIFSGILLGLAYAVRFQTAIMMAGVVVWLLMYRKLDFKQLFFLFTGILSSCFAGIVIDRWFYGKWVFTAFNYFNVNIMEGKTAEWGTTPWWDYFRMIFINTIPPFSIVLIVAVLVFFYRYRRHVLTWICLPFLLIHIINGHKELRFLFPLATALPLVAGLAFDGEITYPWLRKCVNFFSGKTRRILFRVFISINVVLLLIVCLKPANENFPFYDFMYSNYHDKQVNLYTESGNPYVLVGLPVDFYKPEKLSVVEIKNDSVFTLQQSKGTRVNLFLVKGFDSKEPPFLIGKNVKLVYQNIPGWVRYFNFNNWLKRTNVWSVYEVK